MPGHSQARGHDALYHRLFSFALMVEHLIRAFVPRKIADELDFRRMTPVDTKGFAEFLGGRSFLRQNDVIWCLPTRSGTNVYLYLMVEFQSWVDWWMAVRACVYPGVLWQKLIKQKKLKRGQKLPPVLLIVLYNGKRRWKAPRTLGELIGLPRASSLWSWQPESRYFILDMRATPDRLLSDRNNLVQLLVRIEHPKSAEALIEAIDDVVRWFRRHPAYHRLKRELTELVGTAVKGTGVEVPVPADLMEMRSMLAEHLQTWKREWKKEAYAEGRAEGREAGRAEGREAGRAEGREAGRAEGREEGEARGELKALLMIAERRFGPLPASIRRRLDTADKAAIETWLIRVTDAASLEALFGPVN